MEDAVKKALALDFDFQVVENANDKLYIIHENDILDFVNTVFKRLIES